MWGLYDDDVCDAECADDPACAVDGDEEPKLVGCGCSTQEAPARAPLLLVFLMGLIGLRRRA
jgi:MYXO-CTERM domain-containing protein